jgi:hypothetical protein
MHVSDESKSYYYIGRPVQKFETRFYPPMIDEGTYGF